MSAESRRENLLGAIVIIFVLAGMATGNAYALLGISATGLVLMAVFLRRRLTSGPILVVLAVAVVTAAVIGVVLATR